MTFNEWMLHIRRELNYPKEILDKYEQAIKPKASVPSHQRGANENRNSTKRRNNQNSRVAEAH